MNPTYICSICGQETFEVDVDYLIGTDHLACLLMKSLNVNEIKIGNWEKINGEVFYAMGCELTINDCKTLEKSHTAYIYQTKFTPSEALMRVDVWFDGEVSLKIFPPDQFASVPIHLERTITKEHVKNPSLFIATISEMLCRDDRVKSILRFYQ